MKLRTIILFFGFRQHPSNIFHFILQKKIKIVLKTRQHFDSRQQSNIFCYNKESQEFAENKELEITAYHGKDTCSINLFLLFNLLPWLPSSMYFTHCSSPNRSVMMLYTAFECRTRVDWSPPGLTAEPPHSWSSPAGSVPCSATRRPSSPPCLRGRPRGRRSWSRGRGSWS